MTTLVALKPFTYNTRRLLPGQTFEAKTAKDAFLLKGIKKARDYNTRDTGTIPKPETSALKKIEKFEEVKIFEKEIPNFEVKEIQKSEEENLLEEEKEEITPKVNSPEIVRRSYTRKTRGKK